MKNSSESRKLDTSLMVFGMLFAIMLLSGTILSSSISSADTEKQSDATVTVGSACTMFRESTVPHVVSVGPSSYREDVGTTRLKTVCNDTNGYAIYAIGYSNDTDGDTNMYGEEHGLTIPTGIETGDVSNWSMKLSKDLNAYNPENLTITPAFANYAPVPSTQTKVASFEGATDTTDGSIVETTYAIRVSSDQLADTYTGQVKYTMVHPADGVAPEGPEPEPVYISTINKDTCPTTPTLVTDARDGEQYTIQKLADGNCWFLDNLRLDPATLTTTLTPENTNMDANTSFVLPSSSNSGDSYTVAKINASSKNVVSSYGDGTNMMGVYYNYCAASAGTYCFASGDGIGNAEYDICPKGWRMPTGGTEGEYYNLRLAYSDNATNLRNALHLSSSGIYSFSSGSARYQGETGHFWSSTRSDGWYMYHLTIDEFIYPINHDARDIGLSVRCIAKEPEPTKAYIQDIDTDTCPTAPTIVVDRRDGEEYTIQKLADGKCWLLDNLRLDVVDVSLVNLQGDTNASDETLEYLKGVRTDDLNDQYSSAGVKYYDRNDSAHYSSPVIYAVEKDDISTGAYGGGRNGIYYNYCAASAGSFCYEGVASGNTSEDVCPKGWHLPTAGSSSDYSGLFDAYDNDYNSFVNALRVSLSGYITSVNDHTQGQGYYGYFWAATGASSFDMHYLRLDAYDVLPQGLSDSRGSADSVRCVAGEPLPGKLYIQDVNTDTCPATPTTAYDRRDGNAYTIQRLNDGNCWMLDNLSLDIVNTPLDKLKGDTNASNTTLAYLKNGGGTTSNKYPISGVINWGSNNSYSTPMVGLNYKDQEMSYGNGNSKVGGYYNYCAASAGSYCYGNGTSDTGAPDGDLKEDICPKGWRLATGAENGEYRILANAYNNSYNDFRNAFRLVLSGNYSAGSMYNSGSYGLGWASTYYSDESMRILRTTTTEIGQMYGYGGRPYGYSVRCLAKGPDNLPYMQDVAEWKDSLDINESMRVADKRDGRVYWVTKVITDPSIPADRADCTGDEINRVCTQIWMTQNLDFNLEKGRVYTHDDTDLGWSNNDPNVTYSVQTPTALTTYVSLNSGYDPGNIYIYNSGTTDNDIKYNSLSECIAAGHTKDDCEHYHFGNVYPFDILSAYGATSNGEPIEINFDEFKTIPNSICPAGWKLPSGPTSTDGYSDYDYMLYANGIMANHAALNSNPGYAEDGFNKIRVEPIWLNAVTSVNAYGSVGIFWSGTGAGQDQYNRKAFAFIYGSGMVVPSTNYGTTSYYPARCVAREDNVSTGRRYIQDVTPETCPVERTLVYDKRDEKEYYIQKLTTNGMTKCWMTSNLDLEGGTTLNASTSNIAYGSSYTLPESSEESFSNADKNAESVYNSGNTDCSNNRPCYSYYSYDTATAGTTKGVFNGEATYDICPSGWRLPRGTEFKSLFGTYFDSGLIEAPFYGSMNGHYEPFGGSYLSPTNSVAWYWISYRDAEMYGSNENEFNTSECYAYHSNSSADTACQYGSSGGYGAAVRCVAKEADEYLVNPNQGYDSTEMKIDIRSITPSNCPKTPTVVYDFRDDQSYTVQKLADGKCWMLDNLRLGRSTMKLLTPDDTNIRRNYTLPGSVSTGFGEYELPQINIDSRSDTASYGDGENKIGVYYNFCAATAGTYCQGQGESAGISNEDICPKGWRLPTGGETGEYQNLYSQYNSYGDFKNALRASLSGYFLNSGTNHQGSYGSFWSSTPVGNDMVYSLDVRKSSVPNDFTSSRTAGISIRCVAYEPTEIYIQDVTPETCPTTPTAVYDKRDESAYMIQLMPDGNCWMLDNLKLGRSTVRVLTPQDTNITKNFVLPGSTSIGFNSYTQAQINIDSKNKETSYGDGSNKIGVYYNYCAATAGTHCASKGEAEGTPSHDICPKGWRMPTGGEEGEYQNLYSQYNSYDDFKNALRTSLSGYYKYSSDNHQGSYGSFWSVTPVGDDRIYSLDVRAGSVPDDFASYRTAGISIRCVAKEPEKTYIQDITLDSCPTNPMMVYDRRDDEEYMIQKLADGRCWLLDNLRLVPTEVSLEDLKGNTNASDLTLEYFKSARTGTTMDRYQRGAIVDSLENAVYNIPAFDALQKDTVNPLSETESLMGVKYNYCAASAGSYCFENTNGAGGPYGDSVEDICPAGWRMPHGDWDEYDEYKKLFTVLGSSYTALMRALRATGGVAQYNNSYWTPEFGGANQLFSSMIGVDIDEDTVGIVIGPRGGGEQVRCILKDEGKLPGKLYMQEVELWKKYMTMGQSVKAIDNRDGKKYWVTKLQTNPNLADSRADCVGVGSARVCTQIWMTQNLDLELAANMRQYDHTNTDLGISTNSPNTVWIPKVTTVNSSSSLSNTLTAERSYNYGDYYFYTSGGTSNDYAYSSLSACTSAGHTQSECEHYHGGNLYNFYATAALGATNADESISVSKTQYSNAPNSICPTGWRLPVGAASSGYSDFDYLLYQNGITTNHNGTYTSTGSAKMRAKPLYFIRPGYTFSNVLDSYRFSGLLWSGTFFSDAQSYNMNFRHDFVYMQAYSDSFCGFSVRCIAR